MAGNVQHTAAARGNVNNKHVGQPTMPESARAVAACVCSPLVRLNYFQRFSFESHSISLRRRSSSRCRP